MRPSLLRVLSLIFALWFVPAQAQERPTIKAFKGIEMYSWQNSNGEWVFALLPGTNRLKTETEIKNKDNQISGVAELKKHFMLLAEHEQVFWLHADLKGFTYPNNKMIEGIASSAKKAEVDQHVLPKGERNR